MSVSINTLANAIKANKLLITEADTTIKTNAVQASVNTKQDSVTGAITTILTNNLTESKCLISNNDGKIGVSTVSSADINHLSGCTSNIQNQIDDKINTSDITGAITSIIDSNLAASKLLISDSSGKIGTTNIDESKLQYLTNESTYIKVQLDSLNAKYVELNKLTVNSSGNLVSWTAPSSISSITSLSSLPGTYIFVKNKQTRQRITLTSSQQLHSNKISKIIFSLKITVDGITTDINLASSGIVIDIINKTIDFDYTSTSLSQHDIELKLREADIISNGSAILPTYTVSVLSSNIFEFPTLTTTNKNSPHDNADITLDETLSMTSIFSASLHNDIISSIIITSDGTNPSVTSSISGTNLNYSFIVAKDSDHTGDITFNFGNISQNYSWSAAGILTAANDIYTFPNHLSYDGSNNGWGSGKHLRDTVANELLLTFSGGDGLHSDNYTTQINKIEYITDGVTKDVNQANTSINSINNTITLTNIIPDIVGDVDFTIILIALDGIQRTFTFTIGSNAISPSFVVADWLWPKNDNSIPSNSNFLFTKFGISGLFSSAYMNYVLTHMDNNFYCTWDWGSQTVVNHDISNFQSHQPIAPYTNVTHRGYSAGSWHTITNTLYSPNNRFYIDGDLSLHGTQSWVSQFNSGTSFHPHYGYPNQYSSDSIWHIGWGYNSSATVTRIYAEATNSSLLGNSKFQVIGYTSIDDYWNDTNGTIMVEMTGYSWLGSWLTFTTPSIATHIKLKKINGPSNMHWWKFIMLGQ